MSEPSGYRNIFLNNCALLFLVVAVSLTALDAEMFIDTDPLWHVAVGDLIRTTHAIPEHYPWSFTAGDYHWRNIAWLWDILFSAIHEQLGWHGAVGINAIIIALMSVLVYANCVLRSGDFGAAYLSVLGMFTLFSCNLRPLQVSNLMVALWMLLLGSIARGQIRSAWLAVLPVLMLIWVNMHGGFLTGYILVGAFFLQALHDRKIALARNLFITGVTLMAITFCNPNGLHVFEMVWQVMSSSSNRFTQEWQPLTTNPYTLIYHAYLIIFFLTVIKRTLPILLVERWLAYIWLLFSLTSLRHESMFAIVSAPVFACALRQWFSPGKPAPVVVRIMGAWCQCFSRNSTLVVMVFLCLGVIIWLPARTGDNSYYQELSHENELDTEINFIQAHYAKARLITTYGLSGILLYKTRGAIPVFIDPCIVTAIPAQVMNDYSCFLVDCTDWQAILDRYAIDGVMLANKGNNELYDRFVNRKGWNQVFKGPTATIFMRQPKYSKLL